MLMLNDQLIFTDEEIVLISKALMGDYAEEYRNWTPRETDIYPSLVTKIGNYIYRNKLTKNYERIYNEIFDT